MKDITRIHSVENDTEACLLNVMFIHPETQGYIMEHADVEFFTNPAYSEIFRISKELFSKGEEISNTAIYEYNKALNKPLLEVLTLPLAFASYVKSYCKQLYEKRRDELIKAAQTEDDIKGVENFQQKHAILELKIKHISEGADEFENDYHRSQRGSVTTGYEMFDDVVGSFMGGDYIVLGGSTSMGKTAFALNLANMLSLQDKKVLYFSLEMSFKQLQNRLNCLVMGLDAHKYRAFGFTKDEIEKYKTGLQGLKEWNLDVVVDYNITPEKMKLYAMEKKKTGLDFIIIDYLGLMSGYGNKSLYEKMTAISRQIKLIASELDVPILALTQLNRDAKSRQEKRPVLSDIRESGAIEQDADFVLFAYRDYMYNPEANPKDMEIIVAKNRSGATNEIVKLEIDLKTQCISNPKVHSATQMSFLN